MPTWPAVLGGRWVRGTSMHPPQDVAHVYLTSAPHPILIDLTDFDVLDERYSYLELEPDVVVLGEHIYDDRRRHAILWAHHHLGGRVVYDALGHDARSYDSAGHVRFVQRSMAWLLGEL
jgi:type 1 glutamine amidotransferase